MLKRWMLVFTFEQFMELEQQAKVPSKYGDGDDFLCSFDPIWGVILEFCLESTQVVEPLFAVIFILTSSFILRFFEYL